MSSRAGVFCRVSSQIAGKRGGTYSAVEPDGDFLLLPVLLMVRGEKPEEIFIELTLLGADGQPSGVRLTDVTFDFGNVFAIDGEYCVVVSFISNVAKGREGCPTITSHKHRHGLTLCLLIQEGLRERAGTRPGCRLGSRLGCRLGIRLGIRLGSRLGSRLRFRLGFRLGIGSGHNVGHLLVLVEVQQFGRATSTLVKLLQSSVSLAAARNGRRSEKAQQGQESTPHCVWRGASKAEKMRMEKRSERRLD